MKRPLITLLTDFGARDHYVGAMKGVMLGICPDAQAVDISHDVTPYDIPEAAFTLAQAWQCFPQGTVHLVVVDPGVGSARRPILLEAAGHRFVAPDNGVLTMIYDAVAMREVREITVASYFRQPVSRTFHGRDIFAPVAAYVANGVAPAELGAPILDYLNLGFAKPVCTGPQEWTGEILKADWFGNLITNFEAATWLGAGRFEIEIGTQCISRVAASYSEMEPGELCLIGGSSGYLEISSNQESAARRLGIENTGTTKKRGGRSRPAVVLRMKS